MSTLPLFLKKMLELVRRPLFLSLAVIGNGIILVGAISLYLMENGINPKIQSFLDTLWWSVATVTTVGYGDVSPMTIAGKCMGIVMMLMGTTLFCSFTALFASALLSGQLEGVEKEVKDLGKEVHTDEALLDHHLVQLENLLQELKKKRGK